jgi:hypothetical protein
MALSAGYLSRDVSDDESDGAPTGALIDALGVKRNAIVGVAVGVGTAMVAYGVRVFELFGPVGSARSYPIVGPETWFLLLAIVFASATALAVMLVLTAVRFYSLSTGA